MEIAKHLDKYKRLTILTNALDIAITLNKYERFNVIVLGGNMRQVSYSTVGMLAEYALKKFYCDKLFLGVDSASIKDGLSTPNIEEANLNQARRTLPTREAWLSEEERRVDALALRAEERRDKLRKAMGRSKYSVIHGYLNEETLVR